MKSEPPSFRKIETEVLTLIKEAQAARKKDMNNKTYDALKYIAMIVLPAIATLWSAVGLIWGIAHTDAIVATLIALDTFLGAVLGISSAQYNKSTSDK